MTSSFNEITNIDLKDYRIFVIDVKFEKEFKVFNFKGVFSIKRESYLLKY